jgi:hypothetical protein
MVLDSLYGAGNDAHAVKAINRARGIGVPMVDAIGGYGSGYNEPLTGRQNRLCTEAVKADKRKLKTYSERRLHSRQPPFKTPKIE